MTTDVLMCCMRTCVTVLVIVGDASIGAGWKISLPLIATEWVQVDKYQKGIHLPANNACFLQQVFQFCCHLKNVFISSFFQLIQESTNI